MNFKEILELIDKVADKGIAGLEIEQAGLKLRIDGKSAGPQVVHAYGDHKAAGPVAAPAASAAPLPEAPAPAKPLAEPEPEAEAGVHVITSPIVGTFYRSPNPEAQVFVNIGDRIAKGQVICIIEAMKLMNEIESDVDGVVIRIFPSNGQPVEYGEKLFAVKI